MTQKITGFSAQGRCTQYPAARNLPYKLPSMWRLAAGDRHDFLPIGVEIRGHKIDPRGANQNTAVFIEKKRLFVSFHRFNPTIWFTSHFQSLKSSVRDWWVEEIYSYRKCWHFFPGLLVVGWWIWNYDEDIW